MTHITLHWTSNQGIDFLENILKQLAINDAWAYGERVGDILLGTASDVLPVNKWAYGVIFDPSFELSWWQKKNRFDIRFISAESLIECQWEEESLLHLVKNELSPASQSRTRLFGENDGTTDDWMEARIPRRLVYPIPAVKGHAILKTQQYWSDMLESFVIRFCAVEAVNLEKAHE